MRRRERSVHDSRALTDRELASSVRIGKHLTQEQMAFLIRFMRKTHGRYDEGFLDNHPMSIVSYVIAATPSTYQLGSFDGLIAFHPIVPTCDANVHIFIWNPLYLRRPALYRSILRDAFRRWDLRRITAVVSEANKLACKVALSAGFVEEGRGRNAAIYKGRFVSNISYGILREEVL